MSVFKCKMCGGTLNIENGATVAECEFCGRKQTIPKLDDEKRVNLYDRANHFRRNNDYDKAMGIYEIILNEDKTDAEAYWSILLCRYGVEYVEDPATHKRVPTINRTQYASIFMDEDYKSAIKYADGYQRDIYQEEAKEIDKIQKGILAISGKEEPFDVFICYKETDNNGRRTIDSVLAQDLYYGLKNEGFKVFFSRITLEDKLGTEYEPYIFGALNTAKVMVVIGTQADYFNAVWVKNEWSRYLSLIRKGEKKMLIPAYKDMDPYDLPEEFSHLQAQDMSKLGFMQDLIRGIKKIVKINETKVNNVKETTATATTNLNISPLLKRAFLFLEDGCWEEADEYCEKVLDQDPENAQAYLVKLLVELEMPNKESLKDCDEPFSDSLHYKKILRFGDSKLKTELEGYVKYIIERNIENAKLHAYSEACRLMEEEFYLEAEEAFNDIIDYKDSQVLINKCQFLAEEKRKESIYLKAISLMSKNEENSYKDAIVMFLSIEDYKNSSNLVIECEELIKELRYIKGNKYLVYDNEYGYNKAIKVLSTIKGYKDVNQKIDSYKTIVENLKNKRKRKKKIRISILTSLVLIVLTVFMAVLIYNFVENKKISGLVLKEENGYYVITGAKNTEENLTIPKTYHNKKIKKIGEKAFKNSNIKSIEIANSITSIDYGAFENCSSLEKVSFEKGSQLSHIGSKAFSYCSSLRSLEIPDSVKSIGNSVFNFCPIEKATIPTTAIQHMPTSCLKTVIINGGKTIGGMAFYYCKSLESITIPISVTSIGNSAFYNCTSLTSIKYFGTQLQWTVIIKDSSWDSNTGSYTITYNYSGE